MRWFAVCLLLTVRPDGVRVAWSVTGWAESLVTRVALLTSVNSPKLDWDQLAYGVDKHATIEFKSDLRAQLSDRHEGRVAAEA